MIDIQKINVMSEMLSKMLTKAERSVLVSEIMCQDDYDANDAFKVLNDGILVEEMSILANKLLNPLEAICAT